MAAGWPKIGRIWAEMLKMDANHPAGNRATGAVHPQSVDELWV
jgi:hypothetical protein